MDVLLGSQEEFMVWMGDVGVFDQTLEKELVFWEFLDGFD